LDAPEVSVQLVGAKNGTARPIAPKRDDRRGQRKRLFDLKVVKPDAGAQYDTQSIQKIMLTLKAVDADESDDELKECIRHPAGTMRNCVAALRVAGKKNCPLVAQRTVSEPVDTSKNTAKLVTRPPRVFIAIPTHP
jgi:hypothetical protein